MIRKGMEDVAVLSHISIAMSIGVFPLRSFKIVAIIIMGVALLHFISYMITQMKGDERIIRKENIVRLFTIISVVLVILSDWNLYVCSLLLAVIFIELFLILIEAKNFIKVMLEE